MIKRLIIPEHDFSIDPDDAGFDRRLSYETFLKQIYMVVKRCSYFWRVF